ASDRISAAGVCALVDRLQNYRFTVRTLFLRIEELDRRSPQDMTVEALRQRLATMNQHLGELENQFAMDMIDLKTCCKMPDASGLVGGIWCSLDFETRSDMPLPKIGVYRYIE